MSEHLEEDTPFWQDSVLEHWVGHLLVQGKLTIEEAYEELAHGNPPQEAA